MVECAIKITRKHRWRTRRGGISFFSRSPQGYRPPIISYSSFVFRPTFYFASCISCPPAARRFSHVLHTHTHTHIRVRHISRTRNVIRYFDQVGTFKLDGRGRHVIPVVPSFFPFFLSFFLPSFLAFVYVLKSR